MKHQSKITNYAALCLLAGSAKAAATPSKATVNASTAGTFPRWTEATNGVAIQFATNGNTGLAVTTDISTGDYFLDPMVKVDKTGAIAGLYYLYRMHNTAVFMP